MTEKTMSETSLFIFYALIFLFIFIGFFSKTIFRKYLYLNNYIDDNKYIFYRSFTLVLYVFQFLLVFIFIIIFGLKHSFISSILGGGSLLDVRLSNSYSGMPTILISFYSFLNILFSCAVGFYFSRFSVFHKIVLILMIIFFTSFFGGKSPIINSFILLFFSYMSSFSKIKFNLKTFLISIFSFIFILYSLYFIISIQFNSFAENDFFEFIVNRVGVGQIHGVYEQFALQLRNQNYIYHTIPFANFFYDYTPFNKDLMMHTWGYNLGSESETGVMNSLFIGEALAIGGYNLVFFSPLIVAFNFCLIAYFMVFFLKEIFKFPLKEAQKVSILTVVAFIGFTTDITGVLLFKSLIMIFIFISLIYILFTLVKLVKYKL